MPNRESVVAHFLDLMDRAGGGVTARKMFGEHAVYFGGKVVALLCDDRLFVKPTPGAVVMLPDAPEAAPYPGARPHLVADGAMDDPDLLMAVLQAAADDLPTPKPKPGKRPR
jgi:TfoX/Sxy family transcriptional regulator of competence genes